MAIGTILKGILSGGEVIEKVGSVIDNLTTSKEEKEQLRIELQRVLNEQEAKALEHAAKMEEIRQKEMDSARQREIAVATSDKAPYLNKIITPLLALLILGSCFLFWYLMLFVRIEKEKEVMMAGVTGSLTILATGVCGYYFSTTISSQKKSEQLDKLINPPK